MRAHRILIMIACLSTAACHFGANAAKWSIAKNTDGAAVQINTRSVHADAELIAVRDDGIIAFLHDGRVALVPWSSVTSILAKELGTGYQYGSGVVPSSEVKKNLTLVSRYPQGMTPEIQKRFLASKGQTDLVVLE